MTECNSRVARRLHEETEKDWDPRFYRAVGVGDTGFETGLGPLVAPD